MTLSICLVLLSLSSIQGLRFAIPRNPESTAPGMAAYEPFLDYDQSEFAHIFNKTYRVPGGPTTKKKNIKDSFDDIANKNSWGSSESISGAGSEVDVTASVRECLGAWLQKYNVSLFLDVPCGDANWQGHIPGIDAVTYKGYDIADLPVKRARLKNAKHASMSFDNLDLTAAIPTEKPDMIMVRDVIQHLTLTQGNSMLLNAKLSGAKYLLVTSFLNATNKKIRTGGFYKNNVHVHPFNLPSAVESCQNYSPKSGWYPDDHLELIDLSAWHPVS